MNQIPFSLVFLSGGTGSRMELQQPKQYVEIHRKPLALYSFETFLSLQELETVVVVCEANYEPLFKESAKIFQTHLLFARPGLRRQDSVFNGIEKLSGDPLVCIHDSARPCIDIEAIRRTVAAGNEHEAAVLGVKMKSTVKKINKENFIIETPDRASLWEVQTPQVIRLNLLYEGFKIAKEHQKTVTDDVSLVELLGKPVKIVEGSYQNFKVTTPDDLEMAKHALL